MYVILQINCKDSCSKTFKAILATLYEAGEKNLNFHVLESSLNKSRPIRPKERKLIDKMEEPGGGPCSFGGEI